jgi:hypothetical protein
MGNGLWALVKSLWFYGTLPDRNTKHKLQPTMQPMQNKMEELNPDHHTRPYSNYESNFQTSWDGDRGGRVVTSGIVTDDIKYPIGVHDVHDTTDGEDT